MDNNEFVLDLIASLQQAKSKKQVNADIRQLEKAINVLRLTGTLAKGDTKKEINSYIKELSGKLGYVKLRGKIDDKNLKREIDQSLHNMTFKEIDALKIDGGKMKLKAKKVIADVKAFAEKTPVFVSVEMKKEKLNNDLTAFLNKNSKIRESGVLLKESEKVRALIDAVDDKGTLKTATEAFQLYKSEVVATGYATKGTGEKIKDMLSRVTKIGSLFGAASLAVNSFRKSLSTLKGNDTILTEISKTSEMTKRQLEELGDEAFRVASKYGQMSSGYLLGVQEMARSGYESLSKGLAELSLLAQSAGDMTAENANNYLLATDAAYKYGGSVEKLIAALDGANYISNRNSASLTDISDATRVSASFAANASVAIDELTAAEATMIAATKRSGSEMGRAFRSIILSLQQVSGEFDGEVIDEEQLKKVEARCHSLGVELEYVKDGVAMLRKPMEVLKDLAKVYNSLPDDSTEKQGLISDIGGKYHANALSGLLSRWDLYEKMLGEFAKGTGSALEEAEKTANSWEGRLNSLQNSIDSFFSSLTNKEAIINEISFFDRMVQGAESLIDAVGEIPVILTAVNAAITAMNKDYGITKIYDKDKGKFDIQGNIFGIDITNIKNMKKHFAEAEEAIAGWNAELVAGNADINDFGEAIVQNNAQFKEYLTTCSKDAPASLSGYKSFLNAAGVSTDSLRLKTVMLNAAVSFGIGFAMQVVAKAVSGLYELSQVSSTVADRAEELGGSYKSASSDIDGYKAKIEELHDTINDSGSSISDVADARKSLMTVQDELIDKFGHEKEMIDIITDAVNGQTDAFDRLSEAKWQEAKNEFNDGDLINDIGNKLDGYKDNIDRMADEMSNAKAVLKGLVGDFGEGMELMEILKSNGYQLDMSTASGGIGVVLNGTQKDVYKQILDIQKLAEEHGASDKFLKSLTEEANKAKEALDKYSGFWDTYILRDVIMENEQLSKSWNEVNQAYTEYRNAFESGDTDGQDSAIGKLAESLNSVLSSPDIADNVKEYFQDMYPALSSLVNSWNFNIAFDANTDNLQSKVQNVLDGLKDENGRSFTTEEILGLSESNEQYQALVAIAHDYNMSIEEMTELLKKRNMVAAMDYQGLVGLFGQENVDRIPQEDLEFAYQIRNIGTMTFEELLEETEKLKDSLGTAPPAPLISLPTRNR